MGSPGRVKDRTFWKLKRAVGLFVGGVLPVLGDDDDSDDHDDDAGNDDDGDSHRKLERAVGLLIGGVLPVLRHFRLLLVPHHYHLASDYTLRKITDACYKCYLCY